MRRLLREGLLALAACVACGLWATPAQADFHLMSIREVYIGTGMSHNDAYVVLQMYAPGQNFVQGHALTVYNDAGTPTTTPLGADQANGQNQATILIGDLAAAGSPDQTIATLGDSFFGIGGAVCWENIDCMSWGTGPGVSLPSPAGSPEPAPALGQAMRRSISPGCPTLLEISDDTNDSAFDFSAVAPNPRNNATPPTETSCLAAAGADNQGPTQTLSAKKKQDVDKAAVNVLLDEAGTVAVKGRVKVPTASSNAQSRTVRLIARAVKTKKSSKSVAANRKTKIKIKFSRGAKKKVKAAIEDAGPRRITVMATAKDAAANSSTKKVRFKLND